MKVGGLDEHDAEVRAMIYLDVVGFYDLEADVSKLSGGWKKRVAIAMAIAQEPDLLILDEPTNHMDWDGILWLESWLKNFKRSLLLVSHDRAFLENLTNRTIEINRLYRDGYLSFNCNYRDFLVKKEEYAQTQLTLQSTLSNKARREVDWLRAGVKARTTKSSARMRDAYELLDNLDRIKERNRSVTQKSRVEIDSTQRRAKKLIELKGVDIGYGEQTLISKLDLLLGPNMCLGLLGKNGSGKTSLIKVIMGKSEHYKGEVFRAEQLRIVYFDQNRQQLPQDISMLKYLGDGSDYVIFKDQSIHVASYASRFLFHSEKMQLRISQLSGGEQARLLIAKLFLQPADVLILDEPTNDLDIETIEILEETLSAFEGLVILVSHDRYFLSELCQKFLALDGVGNWATYADVEQWLRELRQKPGGQKAASQKANEEKTPKVTAESAAPVNSPTSVSSAPAAKAKLSYKEKRQLETIEVDIQKAEEALAKTQAELEKPEVLSDHAKLAEISELVGKNQKRVEELYEIWSQLEAKS